VVRFLACAKKGAVALFLVRIGRKKEGFHASTFGTFKRAFFSPIPAQAAGLNEHKSG